ncbi:MAG: cadherin-like domain-containing protein [Oscillochloris sp.]|nr:cadherin-like domain-containing protein [Oscillochloris sp.]
MPYPLSRVALLLCIVFVLTSMPWPGSHQPTAQAQTTTLQRPDGYALAFDGTNDVVRLENPAHLNFAGNITLEAWVKVAATDGLRNIVAHGYSTAPVNEVFLRINNGSYQVGSYSNQGGVTSSAAASPIPNDDAGRWVHLAGVYNGNSWILYRNGVEVARTVGAGAYTMNASWAIGARGAANNERFFSGLIDEVRIWNTNLSPEQIAAPLPESKPASLVGAWSFEEGLGAFAYDSSNYGETGHLGAGAIDAAPGRVFERANVQIDLNCVAPPYGTALALGNEAEVVLGSSDIDGKLRYRQFDLTNSGLTEQDLEIGVSGNNPATASVDFAGDGVMSYVQAARTAANQLQLIINRRDGAPITFLDASSNSLNIESVGIAGLLLDPGGTQEVLAAAFTPASGGLAIQLYRLAADGQVIEDYAGAFVGWQDSGSLATEDLQVLGADLTGDGIEELLIGALDGVNLHVLVLGYDPNWVVTAGQNYQIRLRPITSYEFALPNDYRTPRLSAGDIDGDFRAEPVVAWIAKDNNGPDIVTIKALDLNANNQFVEREWTTQTNSNFLALAVGNTNFDPNANAANAPAGFPNFAEEIVVAYQEFQPNGWKLQTLTYSGGNLQPHNSLFQSGDDLAELALAVGDMNNDNVEDIALAGRWDSPSSRRISLNRLIDQPQANTALNLVNSWQTSIETSRELDLSVQLLDWNHDAVRAVYDPAALSFACRQINEREIEAVIHQPPWWNAIQADGNRYATFGKEVSGSFDESQSIATEKSSSVSGYLGREVGVSFFDILSFSIGAKYTTGYETSSSELRGTGRTASTTVFEGHADYGGSFVAYANNALNCYSYQLQQTGVASDGTMRYCQYDDVNSTKETALLDTWQIRGRSGNQGAVVDPQAPEHASWSPATRDWSSLSLFKPVQQLAGCSTTWAEGAVDLDTGDAATCDQAGAWWQVDLGAIQDMTHIRVWGGEHYHVFISQVDPRSLPNHENPAVLATMPGVISFSQGEATSPVATFATVQADGTPVSGRYIRVQSDNRPSLTLAEVQVFDSRHVEPERYPFAVNDPTPGDGTHQVSLVVDGVVRQNLTTRGNLIGLIGNDRSVSTGGANVDWSLSQETVQYITNETSYSWTSSHGVEIDVVAATVTFGGAYEWSSGTTSTRTRTTSWGSGLILGGGIAGLPKTNADGQEINWSGDCDYTFKPYYYEISDYSNYGFTQRYMVLDYSVPSMDDNPQADRRACRNGISDRIGIEDAPAAVADRFAVTIGSAAITLDVLANDRDPEGAALTITAVGGSPKGEVVIDGGQLRYTPAPGFTGEDRFSYTVSDGGLSATAEIVVTVLGTTPVSAGNTLYLPLLFR